MVRPIVTALFGLALCLAAATFDSPSLYVPGVAFVVLPVAAVAWVELAARGATVARRAGPHTVVEEQPYPVRVEMETGVVPPPGGELFEPLLGWPVPIAGRWSRRLRINVRFSRRGKRVLAPARLSVRDPLRLYARELSGAGGEEVLVLPRVEPVTAPGGRRARPPGRSRPLGHRRRSGRRAACTRAAPGGRAIHRHAGAPAPGTHGLRGGGLHGLPDGAGAEGDRGVSGLFSRPAAAPAGAGSAAAAGAGSAAPATRSDDATWDPLLIRLATFGGLALFGAAHWATLVTDARGGRTLLVVLVAVGGAAALALLRRSPLPRSAVHALAAVVAVAAFVLGLMAAG